MNVDLVGEIQQAQVALTIPRIGDAQSTSRAQEAQTILSFFTKKSAVSSGEHLQANPVKMPGEMMVGRIDTPGGGNSTGNC